MIKTLNSRMVVSAGSEITYSQYVTALSLPVGSEIAWGLPAVLKKFVTGLKEDLSEISKTLGMGVDELLTAFKSRDLFAIVRAFGFSLGKIVKAIHEFTTLIPKGLLRVLQELEESGVLEQIKRGAATYEQLVSKYPILHKLAKGALAGFLIYMWISAAFTANPKFDLDVSHIVEAISGAFTVETLFSTPQGLAIIAAFVGGILSAPSFPWLSATAFNVLLAVLYTGAKAAKNHNLFAKLKDMIPLHKVKVQ